MNAAKCATCGGGIRYHTATTKRGKPTGGTPGWYHSDDPSYPKRDHAPSPDDGRTPEGEVIRHTAAMDQAKAAVRGTLQNQHDYLHAEDSVNQLFRDRR